MGELLAEKAAILEKAGAEIILLCTNTMHLLSETIEKRISVPFLHIVDVIGKEITARNINKAGLLGTKFTMEKNFYKDRLTGLFDIEVVIPEPDDRDFIHRVIYRELIQGKISNDSKNRFIHIVDRLRKEGAQGIILGCTEIPLILKQEDCEIPLLDTTYLHAMAGVNMALGKER
jgi:aspartate racemase